MARSARNVFVSANRDFVNRIGFHWAFLHLRENVTEKVKKSAGPCGIGALVIARSYARAQETHP
jgi:hypothetical protein